jgi:hypothetical protein
LLQPGGVNQRGGKGERRGVCGLLVAGFGRLLAHGKKRGEWGSCMSVSREKKGEEVREEDDRWGPPVGLRKEKKRKGRREGGCRLLLGWLALLGPGRGPVGLLLLFLFFFYFFAFYFVLFEKAKLFEKINFKFCQLLNKVLMCLATHKTLFGKV